MSLIKQSLRGIKWTSLSTVVVALSGLLQLSVLARLLSKEDFGLFASLSVVLGLGTYFVEAGMGGAAIHLQNATKKQLGTAYAINLVFGFSAFWIVYFFAASISVFYQEPRLEALIKLGATILFIQPFGMQYFSLLQRDMRFSAIAKVDILASVVGLSTSIALAMQMGGAESLVGAQIASAVVRTSVLLMLGVREYGFRLSFAKSEAKYFLRFGAFQIGEGFVNYANTQLDVVLIGKLLGQDVLGVFFVAKQLVFRPILIVNPIVTRVALPVFAKLQDSLESLKNGYIKLIYMLAIVHVAIYFALAAFADFGVRLFFGGGWISATLLVQVLCIYAFFRALTNPVGSLQLALGRVDLGFYWNLGLLAFIPVVIFLGARGGALGIATALASAMFALQLPAWYFLIRPLSGASFIEYFSPILKVAVMGVVCFIWTFFVTNIYLRTLTYLVGLAFYLVWARKPVMSILREKSE
ncbi:MOP flippase family protein [Accumulibacter sp.]|uniref:MOP flippase family protein n=1 Tax=Accumulibacter sp. TaxID=2053492 RepID=UPI0028C4C0C2|nr:MOP flippase family protein [Accumulibacter sp.]